jgi:hypothetical protein
VGLHGRSTGPSHHKRRAAQFYREMAFALKMFPALELFIASQVGWL